MFVWSLGPRLESEGSKRLCGPVYCANVACHVQAGVQPVLCIAPLFVFQRTIMRAHLLTSCVSMTDANLQATRVHLKHAQRFANTGGRIANVRKHAALQSDSSLAPYAPRLRHDMSHAMYFWQPPYLHTCQLPQRRHEHHKNPSSYAHIGSQTNL